MGHGSAVVIEVPPQRLAIIQGTADWGGAGDIKGAGLSIIDAALPANTVVVPNVGGPISALNVRLLQVPSGVHAVYAADNTVHAGKGVHPAGAGAHYAGHLGGMVDRKSTRLNSSH